MKPEPIDLDTYQEQLGEELTHAAFGRKRTVTTWWSLPEFPRMATVALVAVLLMGVLVGVEALRPSNAAADVFVITHLEESVRLDVVDIVTDPELVREQLRDELGLVSRLVAIPVSPELVGRIIVAGSSGTMAPEVSYNRENVIHQIILPSGFNGDLLIEYGRPAQPAESYEATTTATVCSELWGMTPAQTIQRLTELETSIRYETVNQHGNLKPDVSAHDLNPDYVLVDVMFLSADELLVSYAASLDGELRHPNCR